MRRYHVCTGSTPEELSNEVTRYINGGWWTVGGVSVALGSDELKFMGAIYAQALTRTDHQPLPIEEKQTAEAVA